MAKHHLLLSTTGILLWSQAAQAQNITGASQAPDQNTTDRSSAQFASEELVVTAQRRAESLQKVPIAVTALSGTQLAQQGFKDLISLTGAVPNLSLKQQLGGIQVFIRGVGANTGSTPGDEASVATYVDDVYQPITVAINSLQFSAVQRVEVLKGPQGTLFGRNASGGVVQIVTRDPTSDPAADVSVGYANYGTYTANAYLSGGIRDRVSTNLAILYDRQHDGYGQNITRGEETFLHHNWSVRSKTLLSLGSATTLRLIGNYSRSKKSGPDIQRVAFNLRRFDTNLSYDTAQDAKIADVSLKFHQDIGSLQFTNLTSYQHYKANIRNDADFSQVPLNNVSMNGFGKTFTNESQLFNDPNAKLRWTLGLYYYDLHAGFDPSRRTGTIVNPLAFSSLRANQYVESVSVYGQATYPIFANTRLTTGLRYTSEKNDVNWQTTTSAGVGPRTEDGQDFKKLTWRLAVDHEFSPEVNGYISYNRGIKSGGFSLLGPNTPGYLPEQNDAYEVGLKTSLFGNLVRLNLAAFYYDWKNVQQRCTNCNGLLGSFVQNAAATEVYGLDVDSFIDVTDRLRLNAGLGWLPRANFTDNRSAAANAPGGASLVVDATGNRTISAPKISLSGSATYTVPVGNGEVTLNLTGTYESKSYASSANRLYYPTRAVFNTSATWKADDTFTVTVWAKNFTDEKYYSYRAETGYGDLQQSAAPATYGLSVGAKF